MEYKSPSFRLIFQYIISDTRRNQRSFIVGCITVFLVVFFLSFIQNALQRSNLIFIKLSEDQVGAFDFLLTPDFSASFGLNNLLNFTQIQSELQDQPLLTGSCPRWELRGNISHDNVERLASILVMNSTLEQEIGLGELWPHRPLGSGECHVSASLIRELGALPNSGETININIGLLSAFEQSSSSTGLSSTDQNQNVTNLLTGNNQNQNQDRYIVVPIVAVRTLPEPLKTQFYTQFGISNDTTSVNISSRALSNFLSTSLLSPQAICFVIDPITDTFGKFPPSLGNVVIIDQIFLEQIMKNIVLQVNPLLKLLLPQSTFQSFNSFFDGFKIQEYAMSIVVLMQNRYEIYAEGSDDRSKSIIKASNSIMDALGYNFQLQIIPVLYVTLQATSFLQIFLNELFFTIIAVLVLLATILIYSLLMSDTEEKVFEYGMLRTMGLKSNQLVLLLLVQSLFFSIPGILLGLFVCFLCFVPVAYLLSTYTGVMLDFTMSQGSLLLGILLGLLMPVIGVILPIRRALSRTIRDSLDIYHNAVFDTTIKIQKLSKIGVNFSETILSIIFVVVGFIVYYLIPLSFSFGRLDLFFRIMSVILLGMVLGQVLLGQVIEGWLERGFVYLLSFAGGDQKMSNLVVKNLAAHSGRNRKTSIMFTLCLGYIIFAATMFTLQAKSLSSNLEWVYGADINVQSENFNVPLPEEKIADWLNSLRSNGSDEFLDIVVDFTWVTFPLNSFRPVSNCWFGRLSSIKSPNVKIYGIQENFLKVVNTDYLLATQTSSDYDIQYSGNLPDVVSALYSSPKRPEQLPNGFPLCSDSLVRPNSYSFGLNGTQAYDFVIPCLISDAIKDSASIDVESKLILTTQYQMENNYYTFSYLAEPVAILKKLPAFPAITRLQTANTPFLINMNDYQVLLNQLENKTRISAKQISGQSLPKSLLLVKLTDDASTLSVEAFVNHLNSLIGNDQITVTNLRSQVANTQQTAQFIMVVFDIVAIIGVVLSFFVLLISFTSNVRENSWEIGVLRSIGLSLIKIYKLYIYEATSLLFACIALGTILGIWTACVLTLQSILFSEMPFVFQFPSFLYVFVILLSLLLAVYGSLYPIQEFNKKPIAVILKGS